MFELYCTVQSQGCSPIGHCSYCKRFFFPNGEICWSNNDFIPNLPRDCCCQGDLAVARIGCLGQQRPGSSDVFAMKVKATKHACGLMEHQNNSLHVMPSLNINSYSRAAKLICILIQGSIKLLSLYDLHKF